MISETYVYEIICSDYIIIYDMWLFLINTRSESIKTNQNRQERCFKMLRCATRAFIWGGIIGKTNP